MFRSTVGAAGIVSCGVFDALLHRDALGRQAALPTNRGGSLIRIWSSLWREGALVQARAALGHFTLLFVERGSAARALRGASTTGCLQQEMTAPFDWPAVPARPAAPVP